MCLHQGTDIPLISIDALVNMMNLKTMSNVQIPIHCFGAIPTKLTSDYIATTPCTLKMEKDEKITIQNPQLAMLPTVHLKDVVDPAQVLLTLIRLPYDVIQIAKYTVMRTLQLHFDYQEIQNFEICYLNVEKSDTTLPCTLLSA